MFRLILIVFFSMRNLTNYNHFSECPVLDKCFSGIRYINPGSSRLYRFERLHEGNRFIIFYIYGSVIYATDSS